MAKLVWELISNARTSELLAFQGTRKGQWPNELTVLHPLVFRPRPNAAWTDCPVQPKDEQRITLKCIGPLPSSDPGMKDEGRVYSYISESDVDVELHVYEDRT